MKKNQEFDVGRSSSMIKKICVMMKLVVCLLTLGFSTVMGSTNAQVKLSLSLTNATLPEIFEEISRQTGYHFAYSDNLLEKQQRITISFNQTDLDVVLQTCLKETGLGYRVEDKIVMISSKFALPQEQDTKREIRGMVRDKEGLPLPGVTVLIKGTTQGVATHHDGTFGFMLPQKGKTTLVFSFVGMQTQEVVVDEKDKLIEITLEAASEDLQEVVVTGYSSLPKERATGSINVISKKQLDKPTTNFASRLIGTTAGLASTLDSEGNPTFEIRGQTSLYANAQPLLVVDGFPVEGGFNSINPNDVESVTILKDAAAASIWGARAANGVIVVTTKKAEAGNRLKVELSGFVKFSPKLDLNYVNPLASSSETIDYEQMAFDRWSTTQNNGNLQRDYYMAYSQGLTALNEYRLGNITEIEKNDILNALRKNDNRGQIKHHMLVVPLSQQYNLTVSSASQRSSNIFSFMFSDHQSQFKNTDSQEYMLNYRNFAKITKWMDFSLSGMLHYSKDNNNGCSLATIQALSPYDMLIDENGDYLNVINDYYQPIIENQVPVEKFPYSDWSYNPLSEMDNRDLTTQKLNIRLQAGITLQLLKGLSYDAKVQYEILQDESRNLYKEGSYYVRNLVNTSSTWNKTDGTVTPNLMKGDILEERQVRTTGYNFRNQLNFSRRFDKHEIDAIAGTEISNTIIKGTASPTVYGYNDDRLTVGTFPNGTTVKDWMGYNKTFYYTPSYSYLTSRYFSLYGNVAYTFDSKYTLSGSVRTDASNLITDDPKYRYSPFWSIGLRWQLYREKFMTSIEWLDRLTLRVTYGYNGNVDNSTSFRPLISLQSTPDLYTNENVATIVSFGNPTLRWEKVGTLNIGFDYSIFAGKLLGKLDYYRKDGKDLLAKISIPSINGTTSQKFNNAAMQNHGIELEIGTTLAITENIEWQGNLNFAWNRNKITKLFKQNYTSSDLAYGDATSAYVEGKNSQTLWAYKYAGIHNVGTAESPDWQPMVQGPDEDTLFAFADGFPKGDATTYMLDMGTKVAPYTLGFTNQFKIYNFDFSFIITGKFGHVFNHHSFNYPDVSAKALPNARYSEVLNCDPMKMLPLPQNDVEKTYSTWFPMYKSLDYLADKANHVRLQEINLTYHVPAKLLAKIGISSLRLYAQANNLFVITNNKYDEDPETPLGTYRLQPQYTFGFKLDF
ncbi:MULTISPECIES: SusC/RagA family TonB-linked outer membrane protein [Butyricimonas]|jgi:tonB-linked outer membrane protein, susC/ragA family|uniref:SusC/RagA family TonB-linked outer membrane protein n=1 Tax=Butyricimonas paravirosa TaxID=1472417 RepID=A0A7X6BM39_9BACT|nr:MULTISPECIES: SusC/RagA family TonB-linked outer membrane protein [Odoribacteraceae]NJC20158.1 TonB-linked SusC/RagA family outer membrane protein [Butyricimonas paravirosa]RGG47304.1 SusC/RagA family TonB-linked outer membrane protein [Odoribacter sp. AF21-41]RHH91948.1 SusC/RagA family TonB-linked outer membrane protein [Odoribacter sp. AM16-33]WOF12392.1 SusC/RagA family TonB-linked outer membrane protein [Butyricimonas paravirosa]